MKVERFIQTLITLAFLLFGQFPSLADTILYPGSFNPFHRTHYEEVENALSLNPKAKVTILPIEEASYTKDSDNQPLRVRLFSFPQEISFIEKSFEDKPRVNASSELRIISGDPVDSILKYSQSVSDPDLFILVGPEVVEKWTQSPNFPALLDRVKLIVTLDPKDSILTHSLKNSFKGSERVIFSELPSSGIRGGYVRSSVVSQNPSMPDLFSPQLGAHFRKNPDIIRNALGDYHKRLVSHLEKDIQRVVLPALMENGLPPRVGNFFVENPRLASSLFAINPEDMGSVAEAAEELRKHLPFSLQKDEAQTLITDLVSAVSAPRVYELLKSRSATTERTLYRILETRSQSPTKPKKGKQKSLFFDPFGTWNSVLTSIMRPLTQLSLSDPPEITDWSKRESFGFIEVFRGVKSRPGMESLVQEILNTGFVSKVALRTSTSDSQDAGLSASKQDLLRRGVQSAILEHVFGDYHNTSPFVATTVKKEIAEGFAGKNGYVFRIRVPIREGYFLNDLVFWKNTPWEKKGNPFRYLNEFIIPHKISPEQIVEARQITKEPAPLPTVPLIQRTQSLKIIPFKLTNSVEKTSNHLCAGIFRLLGRTRLTPVK